jgi:hypothetical protein
LAAGESLSVTPSNTQAGGNPSVTITEKFAPAAGDTPKTVVSSLAPGMLSNLNANPSCLVGSPQHTPACEVGTSTTDLTIAPVPSIAPVAGTMYLVPGRSGDLAGIDNVTPQVTTYIGVSLNGQPFTRLPSSCGPATSTMNVTYYSGATGTASGSFTPTGCAAMPYAPTLTTSITRDATDSGAALIIAITQAANDSANRSIVVTEPKGLSPNFSADAPCLTPSGCAIGTATATSPLVPNAALAKGTVTLSGSIAAPKLTIAFPPPFAITLNGDINLASGAVTFASVPDVPLTNLTLHVAGPGGQKAFTTDCVPADAGGEFTAQSGATHTTTAAIAFSGCPTAGVRSVRGLASGDPNLKFSVTRGNGGSGVTAVAIGVPTGLKFARSAFVSHKTCTTKGKKTCTTTTLIKGLGVSGGKAKIVALRGGKLVITLSKPASKVAITVSRPLLAESKELQSKVKKHRVKSLKFTLKITDAKGNAATLPATVKTR